MTDKCEHRWVSVNKMPPLDKDLLITDGKFMVIASVHLITSEGISWMTRWGANISTGMYNPTHYMKLPAPPEDE